MFFVYAFNVTINYLINSFFWHLIVFFVSLDLSGSVNTNLVDLRKASCGPPAQKLAAIL